MTFKIVYEIVKQSFPELLFEEARYLINEFMHEFAKDTECLWIKNDGALTASLTLESGYDVTLEDGSVLLLEQLADRTYLHSLPADCIKIREIRYKNDEGNYIDPKLIYIISGDEIEFRDDDRTAISEFPTDVETIEFDYVRSPEEVAAETDAIDLPDGLQTYPMYALLRHKFAGKGVLQMAGWYNSLCKKLETTGRKYGTHQRDGSPMATVIEDVL